MSAAAPRARVQRRPVHGVLLLDKPLGLSSNQALQKAKWLLRAEKAGHTGTLDPLASGVLPLCFGAATKFSAQHLDADKAYTATLQLGVRTSTGDAEGQVISRQPVPALSAAQLEAVRQRFLGPISQVPPMHSALKKDGKALYEYARAGVDVERAPRQVHIHALALRWLAPHGTQGPQAADAPYASNNSGAPAAPGAPHTAAQRVLTAAGPASLDAQKMPSSQIGWGLAAIEIEVICSKGTYIRTLGEDIGNALGCGGHLTALRRTATGPFTLAQCITLQALEALPEDQRLAALHPISALLPGFATVTLGHDDAARFLTGMRRRGPWADAEQVAVYGQQPHALLGSAHIKAGELIPQRLLSPVEVGQILVQSAPGRM